MSRFTVALATVGLLATAGCQRLLPMQRPPELDVCQGGSDVQENRSVAGVYGVSYVLDDPYPASKAFECISKRLPAEKWSPLTDDWMMPGVRTSHVTGWRSTLDDREPPQRFAHSWLGYWKNANGEIVTYSLRYDSACSASPCQPEPVPRTTRLEVVASWMSVAMINDTKRTLEGLRRGSNP